MVPLPILLQCCSAPTWPSFELHLKIQMRHLEISSLYGDYMEPDFIGKSNTNNFMAPTDLIENPYEKTIFVFKDATKKSILRLDRLSQAHLYEKETYG